MKKFLILFLTLAVVFSFTLAREENTEKEEFEIKYKPQKIEIKIPELSEKQLGPFKELDEFVKEKIAEHPGAEFFMLTPSGHVVQQGLVDSYQNNVLTVSSQGFKVNWNVATDTMVIASKRLDLLAQVNPQPVNVSEIATGTKVKVLGEWNKDQSQFVAKRIVVLERRVPVVQIEEVIKKLQEALQKAGIQIDLTPLLQKLQQR